MADLVIRGMDMPKNCLYCHFVSYDNDHCVVMDKDIPIYGTKPSWCPLLPLPEGHGNMIDVDALEDMDFESCDTDDCYEIKWRVRGENHIRKIIKDAPIIIPAEGDKTV